MIDIEQIKSEIVDRLKPLNPNKIILFGSYAYSTPHQDNNIDLDFMFSREILTKGRLIYG